MNRGIESQSTHKHCAVIEHKHCAVIEKNGVDTRKVERYASIAK